MRYYKTVARITNSEQIKSSAGSYLRLTFKSLDHTEISIGLDLHLVHYLPKVVQIANRHLANICLAVNKTSIIDSDELHDLPMIVDYRIFRGQLEVVSVKPLVEVIEVVRLEPMTKKQMIKAFFSRS